MRRLLGLALAVALVTTALPSAAGALEDTVENRMAALERYMAVAGLDQMMENMAVEVGKTLPEESRRTFVVMIRDKMRRKGLESAMLATMVRHFTVAELEALAAFYGTPEGQSVLKKFGVYMADVLPTIQTEVLRAVALTQAELSRGQGN